MHLKPTSKITPPEQKNIANQLHVASRSVQNSYSTVHHMAPHRHLIIGQYCSILSSATTPVCDSFLRERPGNHVIGFTLSPMSLRLVLDGFLPSLLKPHGLKGLGPTLPVNMPKQRVSKLRQFWARRRAPLAVTNPKPLMPNPKMTAWHFGFASISCAEFAWPLSTACLASVSAVERHSSCHCASSSSDRCARSCFSLVACAAHAATSNKDACM